MTPWQPAFARPMAQIGAAITKLGQDWVDRVSAVDLGDHPYSMASETSKDPGAKRDVAVDSTNS